MRTRNPASRGARGFDGIPCCRFTRHPILSNAARTPLALLAGQLLIGNRKRNVEGGRGKLLVCNAVSNHFDSEALSIADRFIAGLSVTHHAWKFKGLGDPATVFFPIQINRQLHPFIISLAGDTFPLPTCSSSFRRPQLRFTGVIRSGLSSFPDRDFGPGGLSCSARNIAGLYKDAFRFWSAVSAVGLACWML